MTWPNRLVLLLVLALPALAVARQGEAPIHTISFQHRAPQSWRAAPTRHPVKPPLIPLPPVRQHSASACGLSCLQSVFAYYGKGDLRGSQLARRTPGYSYAAGTLESGMRKMARSLGLKTRTSNQMSLPELIRHLNQGTPVTVGIQAWVKNPATVDWRKENSAGHYVVALGIGDAKGQPITTPKQARKNAAYVWFMDPSMNLGQRGYIPLKEFMGRWHFAGENGKTTRFGMALSSSEPPAQITVTSGVGRIY